jgi:hypothetical protein
LVKKTLLDSCNANEMPEEFKEFQLTLKNKDIELLIDNNAASLFDFLILTAFLFKLQEVGKKVEVGFTRS